MSPVLPSISVVIPVRNEAEHLGLALQSILDMQYPGDLEILVADGASTDATAEVARSFGPEVKVVDNPTGTTPSGLNRAIEASSGTIILRCDAHSLLPQNYALTAVRLLKETGAGNVGGVQRAIGTTPLQRAIAFAMTSRAGTGDATFHRGGPPGETDTVYLGVFQRSILDQVGLFDETLIRNQDYELNYRIRASGSTVYFSPELSVEYRPRPSLRRMASQYFQYGQWKRHVVAIHPGSLRLRQLAPPILVLALVASAALGLSGQSWAWALGPTYLAGLIGVALIWLVKERRPAALLMPAALLTMHLSWGTGFLKGLSRSQRPRIK
jgi:succinoglycan biosynthesis protein ExoA